MKIFLVARGGLATKTPKSLIYIGVDHKIATNRCSTCLEHLMPHFDINILKILAPKKSIGCRTIAGLTLTKSPLNFRPTQAVKSNAENRDFGVPK
ncbi:hypothetical protein [Undibacterium sp.]|uniref:hypothetical protein n=1 Tax=Undibacterium sp. TaxID=1914977 RepID=UPI0037517D7C